jgi:hypothetical protein
MVIQQSMQGLLPCNTLLPPLRVLITVTFSTPTPGYDSNSPPQFVPTSHERKMFARGLPSGGVMTSLARVAADALLRQEPEEDEEEDEGDDNEDDDDDDDDGYSE